MIRQLWVELGAFLPCAGGRIGGLSGNQADAEGANSRHSATQLCRDGSPCSTEPSSLPAASMLRGPRLKRFAGATLTSAHGHHRLFAEASRPDGMTATGAERSSSQSFEYTSRPTIIGARPQRRRLLGRQPRPIVCSQSTSLRWTWAPDEPLSIDSFADVAPEPSGLRTPRGRT